MPQAGDDHGWLRVLADDLTGACDVAAALLPMPGGVVVEGPSRWGERRAETARVRPLVVRNTQSRTLAPDAAAARVHAALADPRPSGGIVLKKIDTGLRGPLGAELDAAMDAAGADAALVLPAIPEAGRTTVGGRQLVDGVPVHETAFARDPENPVTDCRVVNVLEATSRRRAVSVGLDELRHAGVQGVVDRCRAAGAPLVVGDAETDEDLGLWIDGLDLHRALVVAGSTGVARALRRRAFDDDVSPPPTPVEPRPARSRGALVVVGSAHPATREQLAHAQHGGRLRIVRVDPSAAVTAGSAAARLLHEGHDVALVVPTEILARDASGALANATGVAIARGTPRALVLVGGETAYRVLRAVGDPRLWVERSPAPLAVQATVLDGPLAGTPVVTKGGSSGPPERLAELIAGTTR